MTADVQIASLEADLAAAWNEIEDIRILTTYRPSRFEQMTEAEKTAHLDEMIPASAPVAGQYAMSGGDQR